MSKSYEHEQVTLNRPLSAWLFRFDGVDTPAYIAPHWHRGIELSFTNSGSINDFEINNHHYQTAGGKILVVNSQLVHSIRSAPQKENGAISIIFPYDYAHRLYPEIDNQIIAINDPEQFSEIQRNEYLELQCLLYKIYQLLNTNDQYTNLKLESLMVKVLQLLLEFFTVSKEHSGMIYGKKDFAVERIQIITKYVHEHYSEKMKLEDIADKINVSKEYLTRFFKKHMSLTVGQYIGDVRAQYAYIDILGQAGNLTEIAIKNGFPSTKAMNQAFKFTYQKSASDFYQEKKLKNNN
ncbi:AraC family transcriptional regulator [Companilactobacillus kimchiensis]|uniref:AraC family transcriptional regulator n=1 Tax=Companilactobacillus kimchiensis TaxID=993692 RepID=UPI00070B77E7|nr:response regulator transcription factor [Companilactobacillus kimchiensis]